jgi:hypothetical protein
LLQKFGGKIYDAVVLVLLYHKFPRRIFAISA